MKQKSKHPEWVLAQRKPKTEIRFLNNTYYLYEVTSKWNPEKKRSQKITGKLLGKITPEGFVESDKHKLRNINNRVLKNPPCIKEYGASNFILTNFESQIQGIKEYFNDIWQEIVALSIIRLIHQAPIKNTGLFFETSYISELYNEISLNERRTGAIYRKLGSMRENILSYMKAYIKPDDHILIDATNIISYSERLGIAHVGYNSKREYEPQINLMLLFSSLMQLPVYYRVIPGNIREVSAFKLTLDESGVQNVTIIADKGFYSEDNIETLESFKSQYIIPLRRNSEMINYDLIKRNKMNKYFKYQERYIWYTSYRCKDRYIHLYKDEELMVREKKDYLSRIETHPQEYTIKAFNNQKHKFGTIALYTNKMNCTSEEIYEEYKVRNQIETMIDAMKNVLLADTSYMQNEDALNGWMFINFIALRFYYSIYNILKNKKMISKYSPKDLMLLFQQIRKAKINNQWITCEVHGKTKKLIEKLAIEPIT